MQVDVGMLTVSEIFYSIQGESTRSGWPCVFVRLTGCDLRCSWCDTPYAFYGGVRKTVDEVVGEVVGYGCSLVEMTGGEPLLQEDVYPLMERLLDQGRQVLLETGGHRSTRRVPARVVTILDVKCPESGESEKNDWSNLEALRPHDEAKFVLQSRLDYEFAIDVMQRYSLETRCASVLLSPAHGLLDPQELAGWMLADHVRARLQLQVHKYIWSPLTRGV